MKTKLQHFLHPLNLWCRFKGSFRAVFKIYEDYCWQPFVRRWLNHRYADTVNHSTNNVCERCNKVLAKNQPPFNFWVYTEHYCFCSMTCRDEWLQIAARETHLDLPISKAA